MRRLTVRAAVLAAGLTALLGALLTVAPLAGAGPAVPAGPSTPALPTNIHSLPGVPTTPTKSTPTRTPSHTASPTSPSPSKSPSKTASPTQKPAPKGDSSGDGWWLALGIAAAALAVLVGLLGLAIRRSSVAASGGTGFAGGHSAAGSRSAGSRTAGSRSAPHPPASVPAQGVPPAPVPVPAKPARAPRGALPRPAAGEALRPATVCTELHPQGYVDIDRCLYRAVWAAPGEPVPAPGAAVGVARPAAGSPDPEVLLAFPSHTPGRSHVQ